MDPNSTTAAEDSEDRSGRHSWAMVVVGFLCLLAGSYFDSIRGPLIPPMVASLGIELGDAGLFLAISYAAAALTTLTLIRILNLWSERRVTICLCLIGTLTGLLAAMVKSLEWAYLFAGLVGCTVTTLGTMANVLVVKGSPLHLQGRILSGLHGMYGLGSVVATMTVGRLISRGAPWTVPYQMIVPFLLVFGVYALWGLKDRGVSGHMPRRETGRLCGLQLYAVFMFAVYVTGEVVASTWMTTYMVEVLGLKLAETTPYVSLYFGIMILMRLFCALFLKPDMEKKVLVAALILPLMFFVFGYRGHVWAFPFMGLYGPFFPVLFARLSRVFANTARSLGILIMVAMNALIAVCQLSLGRVADKLGMEYAYIVAPMLLLTSLALLLFYFRLESRRQGSTLGDARAEAPVGGWTQGSQV